MLESIPLSKILVLDIETVPQYPTYQSMSEKWQKLWDKKAQFLKKNEEDTAETIYPRAGIYAEFGKIICVSAGIFIRSGNFWQFKVKSFYGDDEKILLGEFIQMLQKFNTTNDQLLCGHNAKEFDFPYLCRRMLINGLEIPSILNIAGKKPWEVQHIDTMDLWKFGDFKSFNSLELLAATFDIPTPKDDIDGSMVWSVYWKDKGLERIKTYCQKDVLTTAQLLLSFKGEKLIDEGDVIFA
jgi:predicted PolB exonuclease-like 3'-5' exonuclease